MENFIRKIQLWLYRFMSGRYGTYGLDELTKFLMACVLILDIAGMIFDISVLIFAAEVLMVWMLFRLFSKNMVKRTGENEKFKGMTAGIRHRKTAAERTKNDAYYHYYVCPRCSQIVRVPKGKGKVEITCPKCDKKFTRKS